MNKIILTSIFWLLIIFGLKGQNAFITKTKTIEKRTIYYQIESNIYEKSAFQLIDNFFSEYNVKYTKVKMFPTVKLGELSLIYRLDIEKDNFSDDILNLLTKQVYIKYAEFKPYEQFYFTPNDLHVNQWHLQKISASQAWDIQQGETKIKIAIVDDGIDINHEDLSSKIYINAFEIANNGIDDDGNGYIDDRFGWHSTYNKGNPSPPFNNRSNFSHGTHCAGIAASATNNNIGIASIGFNVSILGVACSDSTRPGEVISGYEGILYAVDAGANVISLSWGGSVFSNTGQKVIDYAISRNVVVVAAAGNDNISIQKYPAAFNGVISVAATDQNDLKANFSNYGSWIDVSAPGVDIWSTLTGGTSKYGYLSGTSMACPMVAGLCGLMLSQNERMKPDVLEACLKSTTDPIDSKNPLYVGQLGAGRINAQKALQCVKPVYADFEFDKAIVCPNGLVQFTNLSSKRATTYKWYFPGASPNTSTLKDPIVSFPNIGKYNIKLVVSDGVNSDSIEYSQLIEVMLVTAKLTTPTKYIRRGEYGFLSLELTGLAPWEVKYTDGVNIFTINGIGTSTSYFDVGPLINTKYKLVSVKDASCSGTVYDSTMVFVDTTVFIPPSGNDTCGKFDRFTKVIDFGSSERPHFIYSLRDGTIAVLGLSNKGLIGGDDIFISKFRVDGSLIWTKYYGTSTNEIGYPIGLFDDSLHNLYICGATYLNNPNTSYFFKLDSSGNIIYTRRSDGNGVQDQVLDGIQLSNGNIMFVGTSAITSNQAGSAFVMNSTPNYIWKKSYNTGGQTEHNVAVRELNKRIYMLGRTSVGNGGYGTYMVKMKLDGSTVWQKYIDYPTYDAGMYEIITGNNTIMTVQWLSANGSSKFGGMDVGIIHMDTNGNRIWSRVIGTSGKDDASGFIKHNGYYYISGITDNFDGGNSKLFVIKLDFNGNIKWSKIYGKTGERIIKSQFGNLMTVAPDGSIIILAQKLNTTNDVLMFKIDECGNSNCPVQNVTFQIASDNTTISNANFADIGILSISSPLNTLKNAGTGVNITDNCPPIISKQECGLVANFTSKINCIFDSVLFLDSSYNKLGKPINNYKWIFHDGTFIAGKKSASKLYTTSGVYSIKLVIYSDTTELCTDTIIKQILITNKPVARITSSTNYVCIGDSVALSLNDLCGQKPITINWFPSQYFNDPNSFTPKVSVPNSMWVGYVLKDGLGNVKKDSIYITINNTCCTYEPDFNLIKENFCLNDVFNLTLNKNYTGNVFYKWHIYVNDILVDSSTNNQLLGFKLNKIGKYTFKLTITGTCKKGVNQIELFVNPPPYADAGKDTFLCNWSYRQLGMNPVANQTYKWNPTVGLSNSTISNPIAVVNNSVKYFLEVKDLQTGCTAKDSVIFGYDTIFLSLGPDSVICDGTIFKLKAGDVKVGTIYNWNFGSNSNEVNIFRSGSYIVTKKNNCGSVSDTINIGTKVCFCDLFFPNAFSPDGNATNEYFPQEFLDAPIDIMIFNRWGELLYKAESTSTGWDGTYKGEKVQQDVYMFIIKYKNCNGRIVVKSGTFTLLR